MKPEHLARFVDRWTIEFVRVFPHPIERVWRAITEPSEFGQWFLPGSLELELGGQYRFGGDDPYMVGVVEKLDPPRLLRLGGDTRVPKPGRPDGCVTAWFQYELSPTADGTRLVFTQYYPPGERYVEVLSDPGGDLPAGPGSAWHPGLIGGWHGFIDSLDAHLRGTTVADERADTRFSRLVGIWLDQKVREGDFDKERGALYLRQLKETEDWGEMVDIYREYIRDNCPKA